LWEPPGRRGGEGWRGEGKGGEGRGPLDQMIIRGFDNKFQESPKSKKVVKIKEVFKVKKGAKVKKKAAKSKNVQRFTVYLQDLSVSK
jgi:hypothetical protein